jgi:hypothetical protein
LVAVAQKLSKIEERLHEQSSWFQTGDYRNQGHSSDNVTRVRFPMKMLSMAWKLSMTEEWHQDQFVSMRKLQQQRPQHYKSVLGFSPSEDVFSSLETMQYIKTMQRTKFFVPALWKLRSQT